MTTDAATTEIVEEEEGPQQQQQPQPQPQPRQVHQEAILRDFSAATDASITEALTALQQQSTTTNTQERLHHLLQLQQVFHQVAHDRIVATRIELRDLCIARSPLLSLSNEVLMKVAHFLDEVSLLALEVCTRAFYVEPYCTTANQRPGWKIQWEWLDQQRHSRSCLTTTPRKRGVQFAQASRCAQQWEELLLKQLQNHNTINNKGRRGRRRRATHTLLCPNKSSNNQQNYYPRQGFVDDFGYFFQDPVEAGVPPVEFFLRITHHDTSTSTSTLLLEGFQSNFESLRHVSDARDEGFQTYIGFIHERAQAVMVRNDLHLLQTKMGLDPRYLQMDSDDSGLESDEEEEQFHFLQWPVQARKDFLNNVTITLLRCSLVENSGPAIVVGSTTGYYESDQHFAIFRPVQLKLDTTNHNNNGDGNTSEDTEPRDNTTTNDDEHEHESPPNDEDNDEEDTSQQNLSVVKIGLGCGGGSSLHIVVKWDT